MASNIIIDIAWYSFKLSFGLFSLAAVWSQAAIKDGILWAKDTEEERRELDAYQKKHWSLDREPLPGFRHAFFKTNAGFKLHYVVNCEDDDGNGSDSSMREGSKDVVVFIHGFPDSFLLWRHMLQSPDLQRNNVLIAVDLPGYGGSDSFPAYGSNEVLESLAEFIIEMRKVYLHDGKKIVVAAHDWGSIVGARFAAEAGELADHWILTSVMVPHLVTSNALTQTVLCRQMLHTWIRSPTNIHLLQNSLRTLGPVVSQFQRSFYIFCFFLPRPFSSFFSSFGNYWFLRVMHQMGKGPRDESETRFSSLNTKEAAESMAMSVGPGPAQMVPFKHLTYSESVKNRITADRGMAEKIRIYREGLFLDKWDKSLNVTAALFNLSSAAENTSSSSPISSTRLLNTAPEGALKAPATLILGEQDPAFDRRLVVYGVKDFLVKGSQVLLVEGGGHWLPLETSGRHIVEKTVQWALGDDSNRLKDASMEYFAAMSDVRVIETL